MTWVKEALQLAGVAISSFALGFWLRSPFDAYLDRRAFRRILAEHARRRREANESSNDD